MTLFSRNAEHLTRPLAEKMRPAELEDIIGQHHLLAPEKPLYQLIKSGKIPSLIFWGPPGTGKTTLSRIIAKHCDAEIFEISAVTAGVKEIKEVIKSAEQLRDIGRNTILFIDEIHRFNKAQQDVILPHVERGLITLIGSTTENPSFQVNPALRSRCSIFELQPVSFEELREHLLKLLTKLVPEKEPSDILNDEALDNIVFAGGGDVRRAVNALELCLTLYHSRPQKKPHPLTADETAEVLQQNPVLYDKNGTEHYDHASAFQKSMRGSDPDAAVYYLAKMIAAGEDPRFIARRIMVTAAEDVGNADPQATVLASAVCETVERIGLPEARIPLAQAVIYIANAPKSNAAICAVDSALSAITKKGKSFSVPPHLRDTHYKDAEKYGHGKGYLYSHKDPTCKQQFLPDELTGETFYKPKHQNERRYEYHVSEENLQKVLRFIEENITKQGEGEYELSSPEMAEELNIPQQEVIAAIFTLERRQKIELHRKIFCKKKL